jgi:hypothetical protein
MAKIGVEKERWVSDRQRTLSVSRIAPTALMGK